jgi:hypothetical protein
VVEKSPHPPLIGEQYGKMEPKYPEGGHCQGVLRNQGVFNVFFINKSVETAMPFNVVSHPRCCEPIRSKNLSILSAELINLMWN